MDNRRWLIGVVAAAASVLVTLKPVPSSNPPGTVKLIRVPTGGIQPQVAVDQKGTLHLVYFKGDPAQGDVFYVHSSDGGESFSSPIRVNGQEGSAVALGTIRGAQLALGKGGRVHVAWNGSTIASPKGPLNPEMPGESPYNGLPMLYARVNDSGTAFEPQQNLMKRTFGLDGGGSVAADSRGNVYVAWHAKIPGATGGEDGRQVWVARSRDEGRSFAPETVANSEPTGACGCCGLRIFLASNGTLYILYRSATKSIHRDVYLLLSRDEGKSFAGKLVDQWEIDACPMTSVDVTEGAGRVLAAWQTREEVYYTTLGLRHPELVSPVPAPGTGKNRKYPFVAINPRGDIILVWTEDTGWGKGGTLAWQVFGKNGQPRVEKGSGPSVPAWSFGSVFVRQDGGFSIVY